VLNADSKIGALICELDRLDLLDKTLIVLTSDHGEILGHGRQRQFGHGTLDYGALRIPLVMSLPGKVPEGTCVTRTALSIDILPTIVDVLDLEDDAERQGISLFSPRIDSIAVPRLAFATGEILMQDNYTLITPDWQYIVSGDQVSLHNLEDDPYQSPNVVSENASLADSLQAFLEDWLEACLAEAVVPFRSESKSFEPGREALERLRALGYIQ
jgi:arylsulfatase A-like enzyme